MSNLESLALLKFGLNIPLSQHEEALKIIRSTPAYRDDFEKIKNNIKTMIDEDEFLNVISSSHKSISEISENSKVIQIRDKTFQIRAINPENIPSLTERAFFNSFNLDRIVPTDLEEEENYNREAQKTMKAEEYRKEKELNKLRVGEEEKKPNDNEEEFKCICGKVNEKYQWVQCSRENKCKGSNWYHVDCSGVETKNIEAIESLEFTCAACKFPEEIESSGENSFKRIKRNE